MEDEMKKITKKKLNEILEKHKKWLEGKEGGERADLSNANLSNANLSKADLRNANLRSADLSKADLRNAYLSNADLRNADLSNANLRSADLSKAYLRNADLSDVDLSNADLRNAYLSNADLSKADLSNANLRNAYLRNADLRNADLSDVDLSNANLRDVDLSNANLRNADLRNAENIPFIPYACPDYGSFIGYKKVKNNYIVELEILSDAKRCSATGRKCRCSKAKVLNIQNIDGTIAEITEVASKYNSDFIYKVGEIVEVPNFCEDRWQECAAGIHFFINRQEAVNYYF